MQKTDINTKLHFSKPEELANAFSHRIGFVLAIIATSTIVYFAILRDDN